MELCIISLVFTLFVSAARAAIDGNTCPSGYLCVDPKHCKSEDTQFKVCGKHNICCQSEYSETAYASDHGTRQVNRYQPPKEDYDHNPYNGYDKYSDTSYNKGPRGYDRYQENYDSDRYSFDGDHYDSNGPSSRYPRNRYEKDYHSENGYSNGLSFNRLNYGPYEKVYSRDFYDNDYNGPHMSREAYNYLSTYNYVGECGVPKAIHRDYRPRVSTGHVVGSSIAQYGEFPWQVAILYKASQKIRTRHGYATGYKFHCGGTVIAPGIVLTAAHCVAGFVYRKSDLKVKLGEWNLKGSRGEMYPAINRKVFQIIIHEKYDSERYAYDIALLVLDRPVAFSRTPHIAPACLPPNDLKFKEYSKCVVVGWGDDYYKPNYGSNLLKKAGVTLQKDQECEALIGNSINNLADDFYHDDTQACVTGGYGKDACVGDGGGAVVCPISNKEIDVCKDSYGCNDEHYFIAGIVSWGSEHCGDEDSVTVIADMVHLVDWVEDVLRHAGGTKSYNHAYWDQDQDRYSYRDDRYYGNYRRDNLYDDHYDDHYDYSERGRH